MVRGLDVRWSVRGIQSSKSSPGLSHPLSVLDFASIARLSPCQPRTFRQDAVVRGLAKHEEYVMFCQAFVPWQFPRCEVLLHEHYVFFMFCQSTHKMQHVIWPSRQGIWHNSFRSSSIFNIQRFREKIRMRRGNGEVFQFWELELNQLEGRIR